MGVGIGNEGKCFFFIKLRMSEMLVEVRVGLLIRNLFFELCLFLGF